MKDERPPEIFNMHQHGRNEANLFCLGLTVLFGIAILGTLFPVIEWLTTVVFITIIVLAIGMIVGHRLHEVGKMYHVMHADPETLRRENPEDFYLLTLEREYLEDDKP
jgi:hypothetical protein